jgi:hypothetical protein
MKPIMAVGTFRDPNPGPISAQMKQERELLAKVDKKPNVFEEFVKKIGNNPAPRNVDGKTGKV